MRQVDSPEEVGGGYIFIHRMLLDYFADVPPQEMRDKLAKPNFHPS